MWVNVYMALANIKGHGGILHIHLLTESRECPTIHYAGALQVVGQAVNILSMHGPDYGIYR